MNTLAESGTQKNSEKSSIALVSGKGTVILNNPALANRARRKLTTQKIILALIDVAKEKGETERIQAYWNTYHCLNNVIVSNGKMYGRYSKNRFCTICNAIQKAEMINRYYPTISEWPDVHLVTLTVKSCAAEELKYWIKVVNIAFNRIHNRCKKRY